MDPCTQGLLGASLSGSFAKKKKIKIALICGAVGGMAPDLDVLINSSKDQLLFIEYHRHFTHSLAFIPIGGLIVSLFMHLLFKNKSSFKNTLFYTTLGFSSHGILDACTSYGTNLLWPFSDLRVSWNIISIVDPLYTSIFIIFVISSFILKSVFSIRVGLILSLTYLMINVFKLEKVKAYVEKIAEQNNHNIERLILNPTIGNNLLWRTVYESNNFYYINAIYMPLFSNPKVKRGSKLKVIDKESVFPELGNNSTQRHDIRRFSYFSQDFIYIHPDYKDIIADLRYGTLPHDYKSMWGIKIDTTNPNKHADYKNLRNFNKNHFNKLWLMMRGEFE